ncbi:5991_t:CDS:1, partial [Cetraspora pellucida]
MSYFCNRCKKETDHKSIFCSKTQCDKCKGFGHINFFCPTLPCRACKSTDHTLQACQYEFIHSKNYIYGISNKKGLLNCGCNQTKLLEKRKKLQEDQVSLSNKRQYHCCNCNDITYVDKLTSINNTFLCFGCKKEFINRLPNNDNRKIQFVQSPENQRDIVSCVICKKNHHRFSYLDGIGDFCSWHHQAAYKVLRDIEDPNKALWTRIKHWTTSSKTRLSSYSLNQTAILRIVLIYQKKLKMTYEKALETQIGDFFNPAGETDDYDDEEEWEYQNNEKIYSFIK